MNIFQIPRKLSKIRQLPTETEREKAMSNLAQELELFSDSLESKPSNEAEWVVLLKKAHKDYLNQILAVFGFALILISGIMTVWHSIL